MAYKTVLRVSSGQFIWTEFIEPRHAVMLTEKKNANDAARREVEGFPWLSSGGMKASNATTTIPSMKWGSLYSCLESVFWQGT